MVYPGFYTHYIDGIHYTTREERKEKKRDDFRAAHTTLILCNAVRRGWKLHTE